MTEDELERERARRRRSIRLGSRKIELPDSRIVRVCIGLGLVIGGILGFLPVLGFWMVPLGVLVLSIDLPWARRLRRRFAVWFSRRFPDIAGKLNGTSQ